MTAMSGEARPAKDWTREQRVGWALERFGSEAAYYWVIYRVGPNRARAKIDEWNGLGVDDLDAYVASRHGGGTYWRELRVRGDNVTGAIVSEEFAIDPAFGGASGRGPAAPWTPWGAPTMPPFARVADPSADRLDRLERMIERLMDRIITPAPSPTTAAAGAMTVQDVLSVASQLAQMRVATPMDELAKMKRLAEELYRQSRRRNHDDDDDDQAEGIAGLASRFLDLMRAPTAPTPPAPPTAPTPPAPPTAPTPPAPPTAPFVAERFPGARAIAEYLRGNAEALPLVLGRDGAELDPVIQAVIDAIEAHCGSPDLVALRLGAAGVVDGIIEQAPELAAHRALLLRVGEVFVEACRDANTVEAP